MRGVEGVRGVAGADGPKGPAGVKGDHGPQGRFGIQGLVCGQRGERGEKCIQGVTSAVRNVLGAHTPIQLATRYGAKMCFVKYHVSEDKSSIVESLDGVQQQLFHSDINRSSACNVVASPSQQKIHGSI